LLALGDEIRDASIWSSAVAPEASDAGFQIRDVRFFRALMKSEPMAPIQTP